MKSRSMIKVVKKAGESKKPVIIPPLELVSGESELFRLSIHSTDEAEVQGFIDFITEEEESLLKLSELFSDLIE